MSVVNIITNFLVLNAAGSLSGTRAAPERLCCHETVFSFFKLFCEPLLEI